MGFLRCSAVGQLEEVLQEENRILFSNSEWGIKSVNWSVGPAECYQVPPECWNMSQTKWLHALQWLSPFVRVCGSLHHVSNRPYLCVRQCRATLYSYSKNDLYKSWWNMIQSSGTNQWHSFSAVFLPAGSRELLLHYAAEMVSGTFCLGGVRSIPRQPWPHRVRAFSATAQSQSPTYQQS